MVSSAINNDSMGRDTHSLQPHGHPPAQMPRGADYSTVPLLICRPLLAHSGHSIVQRPEATRGRDAGPDQLPVVISRILTDLALVSGGYGDGFERWHPTMAPSSLPRPISHLQAG